MKQRDKTPQDNGFILAYGAIIDRNIKDATCPNPKSNSEKRFPNLPTATEKNDAIEWLSNPLKTHEKNGFIVKYDIPLSLCCTATGRTIEDCQKAGGVI